MTVIVTRKTDASVSSSLSSGGIQKVLEATGRLPPVAMLITPLDGSDSIFLDRFLTYQFSSNVLIPVDTFSFNFAAPDLTPFYDLVKDGDIATLTANDVPLSTGIIDMVDVEGDNQFGEKVMLNGRDLLAQLEDQNTIDAKGNPIWANQFQTAQVAQILLTNTRIRGFRLQGAPKASYLFSTDPSESKIASLQRFLEPLNCLFWQDPNGKLVIGRPNMSQKPLGIIKLSRSQRDCNVLSIKASRSATGIANMIKPIWSGEESAQVEPFMNNAAEGPTRLRKYGHRVPKTLVVSTPQGSGPQDLSGINQITAAGGGNLLQAHAKREIARQNQKELIVQAVMAGHYNENGDPFKVDTVYRVIFDRASIDENMYLFGVEYMGGEDSCRTTLNFCRLGTIVSDIRAP